MKYFLGISNFFEEISSVSHFIIFIYFFAVISEEVFIFPCFSLELWEIYLPVSIHGASVVFS